MDTYTAARHRRILERLTSPSSRVHSLHREPTARVSDGTEPPRTRYDANLIRRVRLVGTYGLDKSGLLAWSTGEKLGVTLILAELPSGRPWWATHDCTQLPPVLWSQLGWTREAALQRWAAKVHNGDLWRADWWITRLAERVQRDHL